MQLALISTLLYRAFQQKIILLPGILSNVQEHFHPHNSEGGQLTTSEENQDATDHPTIHKTISYQICLVHNDNRAALRCCDTAAADEAHVRAPCVTDFGAAVVDSCGGQCAALASSISSLEDGGFFTFCIWAFYEVLV